MLVSKLVGRRVVVNSASYLGQIQKSGCFLSRSLQVNIRSRMPTSPLASAQPSEQASAPPPPPPENLQQVKQEKLTFHRRVLPSTCVDLVSKDGQNLLVKAMDEGNAEAFLPLISQLSTQNEPAFCALGSLTTALNALGQDPMMTWKGPWRWFADEMLTCCQPLDKIKEQGMTLSDTACLAMCNGVSVDIWQPPALQEVNGTCTASDASGVDIVKSCCQPPAHSGVITRHDNDSLSIDHFRTLLKEAVSSQWHDNPHARKVIVASYSRKTLGQTGDGHFSPLAAYNAASDQVLILDVARFKYSPHWVSASLLYDAMRLPDSVTGRPRGLLVLKHRCASC